MINSGTLPPLFHLITEKLLSDVGFSGEDNKSIISKRYPDKAHGGYMISICILKLCDKSICKLLNIIFKSCLTQDISHQKGTKDMLHQFTKNNGKQCVTNYRPASFLQICSKFLECFIYNTMFTYFIENHLMSNKQTWFKPVDSCVNQLLAITHVIFSSFDDNYEVRGAFLDIQKHSRNFGVL